jgi:hypothetical protein
VSYTLEQLRNQVKRRVRQLAATSSSSVEVERGNFLSDNFVDDAINNGRKQIMISIRNAELWGNISATFETDADIQEYSLPQGTLKVKSVWYDTNADGSHKSTTYKCTDVKDANGEHRVINDPMDVPSSVNPKYRITNKGLRLIVSATHTVSNGVYIQSELLKELVDLTSVTDYSGLSDTLDDLVIDWACHIVTFHPIPNLSALALQEFSTKAKAINERGI